MNNNYKVKFSDYRTDEFGRSNLIDECLNNRFFSNDEPHPFLKLYEDAWQRFNLAHMVGKPESLDEIVTHLLNYDNQYFPETLYCGSQKEFEYKDYEEEIPKLLRSLAEAIEWGFVKVEIDKAERNKEDV